VAIKVLKPTYAQHPEAIGRFYQEARVASDIKHPFIVDILDFGTTTDGAAYYAMELLSGRTLADAIDDRELPVAETCHVLRQVCAAAYASHQAGVIHRDIKPANIFLVDQGDDRIFVKLLDYGLAKLTRPTSSLKTTPRRPIGTPHYMSPEQVAGDPELGPSADVYSIGVVMYELLTGRLPFDLPTTAESFMLKSRARRCRHTSGIRASRLRWKRFACRRLRRNPRAVLRARRRLLTRSPRRHRPTPGSDRLRLCGVPATHASGRIPSAQAVGSAVVVLGVVFRDIVMQPRQRGQQRVPLDRGM